MRLRSIRTRDQFQFDGIGRFGRAVLECQRQPLFTAGQVGIGVTESVQIGAAPEGLAGLCAVFFTGMMDQDDGAVISSLKFSHETESMS